VEARAKYATRNFLLLPLAKLIEFPWVMGADGVRVVEDVMTNSHVAWFDGPVLVFRINSVWFVISLVMQYAAHHVLRTRAPRLHRRKAGHNYRAVDTSDSGDTSA
jgi:hypothetical protein